jgi:hypothetical protein
MAVRRDNGYIPVPAPAEDADTPDGAAKESRPPDNTVKWHDVARLRTEMLGEIRVLRDLLEAKGAVEDPDFALADAPAAGPVHYAGWGKAGVVTGIDTNFGHRYTVQEQIRHRAEHLRHEANQLDALAARLPALDADSDETLRMALASGLYRNH